MRVTSGALALLAGAMLSPALAAEPAALQSVEDGGFGIVAGGTVLVVPLFEGSEDYRVIGFPLVYPTFGGSGEGLGDRLSVRGLDDIRFAVVRAGPFEFGPAGGYTFGRDEEDADRLEGLGDVEDGLVAGAFAGVNFDPFFADIAYLHQVTGDDNGAQVKLAAGLRTALAPALDLTATLGGTYATDDYMDAYFSVSPEQSADSGLDAFDADAGFKSVGVDLELDFAYSEKLTLSASGGYSRLIGDAADSPVIETENQFRGSFGLTYRFGPFN